MRREFSKKAHEKLRIKNLSGHDVHVVEGDNPKSLALLAIAYKVVYEAGFPMEEERESLETWVKTLKNNNSGLLVTNAAKITISILGENLDTPNPTLKAMTVGYYYNNHDVGLLAYIVTAPKFQGKGLGRAMNEANNYALMQFAKNKGTSIKGIFFEVNDPDKIKPEDDVMDPTKRIEMYKKWGAIVLPIDYIQPPLAFGAPKCETLKLMAYRHPETGEYPTKEAIKAYITGIYAELAECAGHPPDENPDYIKIIKQIDAMKPLSAPKQKPPSPN